MIHLRTVEQACEWLRARVVSGGLKTDSRQIKNGDGFIAWPGASFDARQYVNAALQLGASACVIEAEGAQSFAFDHANIASFKGLKDASGSIAAAYLDYPSRSLDVVAVTGTNGKTSTAWWLAQCIGLLRKSEQSAQYKCGLIGTFGVGIPGKMIATGLTTPDPVTLQSVLAGLRDKGATACAIEASSIGLVEHRLTGTQVLIAIFTNLTQDHLDYHGSMQTYWLAKRKLFEMEGLAAAVINLDDPKGAELVTYCKGRGIRVITTSMTRSDAQLMATSLAQQGDSLQFTVSEGMKRQTVTCPSAGEYNAANMLGVMGALRALNVHFEDACNALSECTSVPGRMECIQLSKQPLMVVDYAHTPDALTKVLKALRPLVLSRGGQLWCVFGCGGNRDANKRALMAQAAQRNADRILVTSDNPRFEDPQDIAAQVMQGFDSMEHGNILLELDRSLAIARAARDADDRDVILIAGKGHEDYQEIAGVRHAFSDQQHARSALTLRSRGETKWQTS